MNAYSRFNRTSQNLETTQMLCSSKDEWVHKNKQIWRIHTMKYFSAVTRNGWTLDTQK